MVVIALLVPVALLLLMFALDALEDLLFPPPDPPAQDPTIPDQSIPE
ncbi:hypothetical protein AB0C59_18645 [Streptomyces sp. NPDC048664]